MLLSPNKLDVPTVRLYVLGTLRLERYTRPGYFEHTTGFGLHQKRVQSLLASLLSSPGRRLGREQLMEILWPEEDAIECMQHELDRIVYELRQLLEPQRGYRDESQLLLSSNGVLTLADQARVWVDADAFETVLQAARSTADPLLRRKRLQEVVPLYTGDFFPVDCVWSGIAQHRETLRRAWHGAMLDLADLWALEEELFSALIPLNQLLSLDPFDEDAALRFLFVLTQQRRRSEAIRFYLMFHQGLRTRHIRPHPKMKALYLALMRGYDEAVLQAIAREIYSVGQ